VNTFVSSAAAAAAAVVDDAKQHDTELFSRWCAFNYSVPERKRS
jgi:hypothetical protein